MRRLFLLFILSLMVFTMGESFTQTSGKKVVFLPFYDESGYKGPWNLKWEVPEMIGDMLGGADSYFMVVPMDSVRNYLEKTQKKPSAMAKFFRLFSNRKDKQKIMSDSEVLSVARTFGGDIAIIGQIDDFNFRRTGGGDPYVGGYKSFTAKVKVKQVRIFRVADGTPIGTVEGEDTKNSRGLGLELFGKPRQLDLEFYSLDSLEFGSKRFINTIMGQTTVEALNKVHKGIRATISKPDSNWFSAKKFKILSIEAGMVIIDAGSADGVASGDKYNVYASESGIRVGKINILSIWSDHAAKAEILEGKDEIRPNDYILPDM